MNYELAKQLKDSGFPQEGLLKYGQGWNFVVSPDSPKDAHGIPAAEYERLQDKCYCPTLSELIAACGEPFDQLIQGKPRGNVFCATGSIFEKDGTSNTYRTSFHATPEEAVAKLWLALHT
jgi:hypothetical protein